MICRFCLTDQALPNRDLCAHCNTYSATMKRVLYGLTTPIQPKEGLAQENT